ncbi:loganic acid O-methyltransferase-like [Prosopis cineraria]|uniref:loganic acid O-methyltransferase-like n=1 Tax=Prosopis cineraria TaxID=364024 RepID=UPI00240FB051|nr:loganic acid O-methyltransferase-like [Prosopis cineraria]
MERKRGTQSYEAVPMNGGNGEYSYAQNSTMQRRAADIIKNTVKAIFEKLDLEILLRHSSNVFRIADLGCSVGPNTFFTVQNIIDVVTTTLKLQSHVQLGHAGSSKPLEFQVFSNDHVGNDFNTLFKSIPEEKQYYAAATPGSFHARLFPESSIIVFNSSYALHWLSRVPKDIIDKNSHAYNKGRIYFASEDKEVAEAYSAQFAKDIESFLNCKALELVPGGIMILIIPCVSPNSVNRFEDIAKLMEDILLEMVCKGMISDELVHSFNLPIYMPTSEEVKEVIEKNGNFEIDDQVLDSVLSVNSVIISTRQQDVHGFCMHVRAVWKGLFKQHFGEELVDLIFIQFEKKLTESYSSFINYKPMSELSIIKRNFYLV